MERSASIQSWAGQTWLRHSPSGRHANTARARGGSAREHRAGLSLLTLLAEGEFRPFTTPLGVGSDGMPVVLRLDDPDGGHVVIAGDPDEQSEGLRLIAAGLALTARPALLQLCAIDISGNGLRCLESLPHCLLETAADVASAEALVRWLAAEVEARSRDNRRWPTIVLAILEADEVRRRMGRSTRRQLDLIEQSGSGLGVHLVAGMRRYRRNLGDHRKPVFIETRPGVPHWEICQSRGTARFLPARLSAVDLDKIARGKAAVRQGLARVGGLTP